MSLSYPATALDYRRLAQRRLPRFLFDYIDGAAGDEITLAANVADLAAIRLRQRVLVNVENVDTRATLAGEDCEMPLALAPVGMAGMMARRGEVQAVRAANAAGVPFTLSTVGICPLDEVRAASGAPFWFQLYMIRDRGVILALLEKAWAAGCRTLVFTVDLPIPGMRHRDTRNGVSVRGARATLLKARQVLLRPGWMWDVALRGKPL
ncbi:MAG TPA: alpha-hydroxy-acid oxidizing protein, partial [Rudaea sp.]|nr:alpha-hydroxy-acid oxidizing protein [Rudaea sp.]